MSFRFKNRTEAGQMLAERLRAYANRLDVIVLGLPRGGVPVAFEIAKALNAPMDVFLVRKLGVPWNKELAMGAIASDGIVVLNDDVIEEFGISSRVIAEAAEAEIRELERRELIYRDHRPPPKLSKQTIILVDDGLATGSTMRAAIAALQKSNPAGVVIAVPIGAADTCMALQREADEVVCLQCPSDFFSVGFWYEDFAQTTDVEVRYLLDIATHQNTSA